MSSTYGDKIKISVFGESHGNGIGVAFCSYKEVVLQLPRRPDSKQPPEREGFFSLRFKFTVIPNFAWYKISRIERINLIRLRLIVAQMMQSAESGPQISAAQTAGGPKAVTGESDGSRDAPERPSGTIPARAVASKIL